MFQVDVLTKDGGGCGECIALVTMTTLATLLRLPSTRLDSEGSGEVWFGIIRNGGRSGVEEVEEVDRVERVEGVDTMDMVATVGRVSGVDGVDCGELRGTISVHGATPLPTPVATHQLVILHQYTSSSHHSFTAV